MAGAEGNDTGLHTIDGEWTTRVTIAATLLTTAGRADHTGDDRAAENAGASIVSKHGQIDLHQNTGNASRVGSFAPTAENGGLARVVTGTGWCQLDGGDVGVQCDSTWQFDQRNIVGQRVARVSRVYDQVGASETNLRRF